MSHKVHSDLKSTVLKTPASKGRAEGEVLAKKKKDGDYDKRKMRTNTECVIQPKRKVLEIKE